MLFILYLISTVISTVLSVIWISCIRSTWRVKKNNNPLRFPLIFYIMISLVVIVPFINLFCTSLFWILNYKFNKEGEDELKELLSILAVISSEKIERCKTCKGIFRKY